MRSVAARKRGAEVSRSADDDDRGRRPPAIDAADFIKCPAAAAGRTEALPAVEADVSVRSRNVDAAADDDDDEDEDEPEERAAPRRRAARDIMATDERISSTKGTKRFPPGSEPEFSREVVYPFTDAESESSSRVGFEKGLLERWAEGTREARERETVAAERWRSLQVPQRGALMRDQTARVDFFPLRERDFVEEATLFLLPSRTLIFCCSCLLPCASSVQRRRRPGHLSSLALLSHAERA